MDIFGRTEATDITKDTEEGTTEIITREELEIFNEYITIVSTSKLDSESQDYFHKVIHSEESLSTITNFITDIQCRSFIVFKIWEFSKTVDESKFEQNKINEFTSLSEESKTKSIVSIILDLEVTYKGSDAQSISFIKRQKVPTINLKSQRKKSDPKSKFLTLDMLERKSIYSS